MEYPQAYNHITRKARKDHRCCECRGLITKGETYEYHSGVWGGRPDSFKICAECNILRFQVDMLIKRNSSLWEDELYLGELREYLVESKDPEMLKLFREIQIKRRAKNPVSKDTIRRAEGKLAAPKFYPPGDERAFNQQMGEEDTACR